VPVWIGVGASDPSEPRVALLRTRLARLTGHDAPGGILPGCHDDTFFERNLPAPLSYLAGRL
jgi:hypothetical protein